ncbi:hypothetical protein AGMMS49925_03710 [Deltaproteobacteria bacterium]|nr:hypothetical protein AGMMS49925_03710 [Deltaproteobacteria bacterium]
MTCAFCVYQAYCGTDPVRNYLEFGNESRKMASTPFCIKHKGIFDYLFSLLENMSEFEESVIWNWINHSSIFSPLIGEITTKKLPFYRRHDKILVVEDITLTV